MLQIDGRLPWRMRAVGSGVERATEANRIALVAQATSESRNLLTFLRSTR